MKLLITVFLISSCISSIAAQTSGKCDPQDSLFGNKCYRFVNNIRNFTSAVDYCRGIGYSLTSVHSIAENNFLRLQSESIFGKSHHNFYIGLYSPSKNINNWVYVDGSAYDFNDWNKGEPSGSRWYVAFRIADGKWITVSNSASIPFVCSAASNNTSPANTTMVPMTTASSGTCTGGTCGTYEAGCSSNGECICFQTSDGNGLCDAGGEDCDELPDCSNCPTDTHACIINTCCEEPKCTPRTSNCPPPSILHAFNLFNANVLKRVKCNEDKDCANGRSCILHPTGRLCV